MPSRSPSTSFSLLTRSRRPAGRWKRSLRDRFSPLAFQRVLLLAGLAAALSVLGSWMSGAPGVSQPSPAPRLQPPPLAGPQAAEGEEDWLARVQRGLAEKEYQASQNRAGLQAPNRAHDLRTYFEPSGIRVHDRTAPGSPELLALSLSGLGRTDHIAPVEPGELSHDGARVEIRRPGLVEWYANSREGLEQGFTVEERPTGEGPLALELAVEGARASRHADRVIFNSVTGRRLAYGKLSALDAEGRTLVARLEVPNASQLRLVVEDEGAAYPVVIDPLLTATANTQLESDQAWAGMESPAGAGDVNGDGYADVIVGAPGYDAGETDEGAAFVFLGSALGIADGDPTTAHAQLEADQAYAELGWSVAGAGDVNGDGYADVIVGASGYDAGQGSGEGAAFVFLGSASGIADGNPGTAHAQLEADQAGAELGGTVAGAGDVNGDGYADVIVGALNYDAGETDEGAAFVFLGSASGIADGNPGTAHARLESDQAEAYLGEGAAGAGDVNGDGYDDVIVGAGHYDAGETNEGAAFVFLGSASGIADGDPGTAHAQLESDQAEAVLGQDVAGAGDVNGDGYADVIVGARYYSAGETGEGAAFVFLGSASGIADGDPGTAHAQLESNQAGGTLGEDVGGAGDVNGDGYADVIVSACDYTAGETGEGAAFVFLGSASGIADGDPTTAHAQLESDQAEAYLCWGAGAGDVNGDGYADVIVSAGWYDAGQENEGAAFVFLGGASGIADGDPSSADTQLESDLAGGPYPRFGQSVAGAGDVNGDGYADVILGAWAYDAAPVWAADEGAAFVFLGSASGIADGNPTTANAQLESDQEYAELGCTVAGAGDVNGDGYADVIVGAEEFDAGETDEGAAFVFLGSASGIADGNPTTAHAQLESNQAGARLGDSVAGAGDVNGDGYADVIVGAYGYEAGETNEGAAFVFLGSASGIADGDPSTAHAQLESNQASSAGVYLGQSVAGAGDVNGDGYADVIVGAPGYTAGETREGAAFVFLGSASGIADGDPSTAHAQLESNQAYARLGSQFGVAGAGDVNGDGYADVIVSAYLYYAGETDEGVAFVFLGSTSGVADGNPSTAHAQLESNQADAAVWGFSVAGAGDVNGDGYGDVIVGAHRYDAGEENEGAAFVFLGSTSGIVRWGDPGNADAQLESNQANAELGYSVAGAGDVNGDGYADLIVGAFGYDAGETNEGAAFVFLGNSEGRPVLAQQLRGDASSRPVQPWGLSYDANALQVSVRATHPVGRGRVKLEVEYCEAGLAFGDPGCGSVVGASWADVTASSEGVILTETIGGLTSGELYRWRARVLHAPYSVTEPGIIEPPHPAHGPWRRLSAQAVEADVRVLLAEFAVDFPDPNLEAVIRTAIGKPEGPIYDTDLALLVDLDASSASIEDLTGLQYCTNLTWLQLYDNQISDLSPLSGLTNLNELVLYENLLSDVSPLAALTSLTFLDLERNQISEIGSLVALTNLTVLELRENQISDLSPLAGLTNLTLLDLTDNQINDISPVAGLTNLNFLELSDNQISDIIPLAGLTNLDFLDLSNNRIGNIGALAGLTNLTWLDLCSNQISDISPLAGLTNLAGLELGENQISDISPLTGLVNLFHLELVENQISDIGPLAGLTSLMELYLSDNQISNVSPLAGLTNLTFLDLSENQLSEISPLAGLINLTDLELGQNQISDLSPLAGLTNLTELGLDDNQVSDLSPLAGLINLTSIDLLHNQISDISPLGGLANLWDLGLEYNQISDISPLAGLTNLEWLQLEGNQISDISPLAGLTNLTELELEENQISNLNPLAGLINLTWLELEGNQISDLSPLAGLSNLTGISLDENQISDLSPLAGLTNLRDLQLSQNLISDISPLAGLINLTVRLELDGNQISDISPLAGLTNLTTLLLSENLISDISPLAGLTSLTTVFLDHNEISDISPLAGLMNLTELDLSDNQISDISSLAGLTNLTWLDLYENDISDISALAGLTNLEWLDLDENGISDISPLAGLVNLTWLALGASELSDIGPLTELTNLTTLYLWYTQITEIGPLAGLTNLTSLYLDGNQIVDISALAGLTSLADLQLGNGNHISNVSPLAGLTNLTWLGLQHNQIIDIIPLVGLTNLIKLELEHNQIIDISVLAGLTSLADLQLGGNHISDLSPLAGLANLTELELGENQIVDLTPLIGLTHLTELELVENWISDISPLAGLVDLTFLYLEGNQIVDISPLVDNTGIDDGDWVDLSENPLNCDAILVDIPTLEARGASVSWTDTGQCGACNDGFDNDGDGLTDWPDDPVCQSPTYALEGSQCQDGLDNDGDGGIDFDGGASLNDGIPLGAPDEQCIMAWKNLEGRASASPWCGLGAELPLVLTALLWVRRRRRQANPGPERMCSL